MIYDITYLLLICCFGMNQNLVIQFLVKKSYSIYLAQKHHICTKANKSLVCEEKNK